MSGQQGVDIGARNTEILKQMKHYIEGGASHLVAIDRLVLDLDPWVSKATILGATLAWRRGHPEEVRTVRDSFDGKVGPQIVRDPVARAVLLKLCQELDVATTWEEAERWAGIG